MRVGRGSTGVQGNYVCEWFGHRLFPDVVAGPGSLADQRAERCPFLSASLGVATRCVKSINSKGVCTINTASNGPRQDWVACPYRVFDPGMIDAIARRLFKRDESRSHIYPAPVLAHEAKQLEVLDFLRSREHVLLYFDAKLGGEIQISATPWSPQISFDVTFVELALVDGGITFGQFANLEIQTMDFHGTYQHAVNALKSALDLHGDEFAEQVATNPGWLARRIEGPNIANVFRRTFWQLVFKFGLVDSAACAGSALAVPAAVWDGWQPFLGAPALEPRPDGTYLLGQPGQEGDGRLLPCFIYVFDLAASSGMTPSPLVVDKVIQTSAPARTAHALEEAPRALMSGLSTRQMLYSVIRARLREHWRIEVVLPSAVVDPFGQPS